MSDKVPDGWKKYKLGDIVRLNPYSIDSNFKYSQIVYLDTGSIKEGKITELKEYKLTDAPSSAKRLVKNNNIIYSTVRPIQRHYGIIKNPPDNMVVSNGFVVLEAIEEIIDPYFLYYFLTLDKIIDTLEAIAEASSSVYPTFRIPVLENLTIFLPSLPEQRAIASVFPPIEDKIKLLQQENKTLEAMAETIFQHLFIEKAKDNWPKVLLPEVVKIVIGKTPPREESYWFSTDPQNVKWASIRDLGQSDVFIFDTSEYLTQEAIEKFKIPITPAGTVLLSFKLTVGRVRITDKPMASNEAIAHFVFDDKTPFSKEYLYLFLRRLKYKSLGNTSSIATAINSSIVKNIEITIPDNKTMNVFKTYIDPLFSKIKENDLQLQTLTQLFDTLLRGLMSGKIRVV